MIRMQAETNETCDAKVRWWWCSWRLICCVHCTWLKVCSFPIAMICYKSLCTSQHRPFHSLFGSSCLPALVGWRVQASSRWQEEGARSHCGGSLPVEAGGEHPMRLAGTRWWWPELPSFMWSFSFPHGVVSTFWKPHRMVEKKQPEVAIDWISTSTRRTQMFDCCFYPAISMISHFDEWLNISTILRWFICTWFFRCRTKKSQLALRHLFSGEISFELAKPPVPGKTPILSQFGAV